MAALTEGETRTGPHASCLRLQASGPGDVPVASWEYGLDGS